MVQSQDVKEFAGEREFSAEGGKEVRPVGH
jgi:hypothetical protein